MGSSTEAMGRALTEVVTTGDFVVPPFPAIALRLQRVLARANYGVAEVADTIAADPALAALVLTAANSALYGGSDGITTLSRAVNRLGARTVGSIALAAGVGTSATQAGVLFDVKYHVWRRSVTGALAAQKLGPLRGLDAEEAFLAALLHGFGRSVAVTSLEKLLTSHRPPRPLTLKDWLTIVEEQRGRLAEAVAKAWQVPSAIAVALSAAPAPSAITTLLGEVERVTALIEAGQRPEGQNPDETRVLAELISGLPAALEALATPPPLVSGRPTSPAIAKPERALDGELRRAALPVSDKRTRAAGTLRCLGITPNGIEVESTRPFQESTVVRLGIGGEEARFEPWLNVVLCAPQGGKYRVELQLFSPTRETREQLQALWTAAGSEPRGN